MKNSDMKIDKRTGEVPTIYFDAYAITNKEYQERENTTKKEVNNENK